MKKNKCVIRFKLLQFVKMTDKNSKFVKEKNTQLHKNPRFRLKPLVIIYTKIILKELYISIFNKTHGLNKRSLIINANSLFR